MDKYASPVDSKHAEWPEQSRAVTLSPHCSAPGMYLGTVSVAEIMKCAAEHTGGYCMVEITRRFSLEVTHTSLEACFDWRVAFSQSSCLNLLGFSHLGLNTICCLYGPPSVVLNPLPVSIIECFNVFAVSFHMFCML